MFVSLPVTLLGGPLYDLLGRGKTLYLMFLVGAIATFLNPLVSPSVIGWIFLRVLY